MINYAYCRSQLLRLLLLWNHMLTKTCNNCLEVYSALHFTPSVSWPNWKCLNQPKNDTVIHLLTLNPTILFTKLLRQKSSLLFVMFHKTNVVVILFYIGKSLEMCLMDVVRTYLYGSSDCTGFNIPSQMLRKWAILDKSQRSLYGSKQPRFPIVAVLCRWHKLDWHS